MNLLKRGLSALTSLVFVVALAACGHNTSIGQKVDDTAITTKVKTALLADPDVKGLDINVETVNGTVQLSGFVDSASQGVRARDIASRVDGVTRVENKTSVKSK